MALIIGAGGMLAVIIVGLTLSVASVLGLDSDSRSGSTPHATVGTPSGNGRRGTGPLSTPSNPTGSDEDRSTPAISMSAPDPMILPASTVTGTHGVATGYPQTQEGAVAQLAAIDIAALQQSAPQARKTLQIWSTGRAPSLATTILEIADAAGLMPGRARVIPAMARVVRSNAPYGYSICLILTMGPGEAAPPAAPPGSAASLTHYAQMTWHNGHWIMGATGRVPTAEQVVPGTREAYEAGYRLIQTAAAPDQR